MNQSQLHQGASRGFSMALAHGPDAVLILGSTGTIGCNTLDVIARNPSLFRVYGLVAHSSIDKLLQQALQFEPEVVVITQPEAYARWQMQQFDAAFTEQGKRIPQVLPHDALLPLCAHADVRTVVAGIVGAAGLMPTMAAVKAGKRVMLANKESLVLAGRFLMQAAKQSGAVLLPVDSEHNAIFQCWPASNGHPTNLAPSAHLDIEHITLTASGGPFRQTPLQELSNVTPKTATAHPNWVMGPKISVDSATMANKALELIEALWLFDLKPAQLSVLIHPQSIVHALLQFTDGSVLAQMSNPDMRVPIANALGFPKRLESGAPQLNLAAIGQLQFETPCETRFPMMALARQVLQHASVQGVVFNAANEVAVARFLNQSIGFLDIVRYVSLGLERFSGANIENLDDAIELDVAVRNFISNMA